MISTRRLASLGLGLHGMVHLLGFTVAWNLATVQSMPYSTAVLGGHLHLGVAGIRALGVVWLLLATSFVALAAALLRQAAWGTTALLATACVSTVVCALEIDSAYAGLVIDVVILLALWATHGRSRQGHPRGLSARTTSFEQSHRP